MKRILITFLLFLTTVTVHLPATATRPAGSADEIMNALKQGKTVRAVFHYAKCKLISDNEEVQKVPDAVGGMNIDTWEYFAPNSIRNPKGFLATSHSVLINHPSYGIVLNYAKLRIGDDGEIRIVAQYLDPKSFEIRMNESFYTRIGQGAEFFVAD